MQQQPGNEHISENKSRQFFSLLGRGMFVLMLGGFLFISPHGTDAAPDQAVRAAALELPEVQAGDIVFERGSTLTSQILDMMDDAGEFSHVGIVHILPGGEAVVVHAFPEREGQTGMVQVDPLADFVAGQQEVAVYRPHPQYQAQARQAAEWAFGLAGEVPFDDAFDLETAEAVYCTELVWRAYLEAGIDLAAGNFQEVELPILGAGRYLFPSGLMNKDFVTLLYSG